MSTNADNFREEKSADPNDVPEKVRVFMGDIGPAIARAAAANGRTLSAEIRARLIATLASDEAKEQTAKK